MQQDIRSLTHGYIDTYMYAKTVFPHWPRVKGKFHGAKSFQNHSELAKHELNFREHHPMDDAKMIYCTLPFSNNCDRNTHPSCQEPTGWPWRIMEILYDFLTPELEQYKVSVMKIKEEPRAEHPYRDWTDLGRCQVLETREKMGWRMEKQDGVWQEWQRYGGEGGKMNNVRNRRYDRRQSWRQRMWTGPYYM